MVPVKLGIIGCGVIGPHHMAAAKASPLIDLVAVADIVEEKARSAAKEFEVNRVYLTSEELIVDPEIDGVVLALPTQQRTELAMRAFACGKHVLTEKPVAMNAGEVEQMIRAKGSLIGACCSSRPRSIEPAIVAEDFVATGALGDLRLIRCRSVFSAGKPPTDMPPEWRLKKALNGGGFLMNWGCYDLDYLLGITGWRLVPKTVLAQTWPISPQLESYVAPGSEAETHYVALICCENGTVITMDRGEYMPAQPEDSWQIVGTKGTLRLQMIPVSSMKIEFDHVTPEDGLVTETIWEREGDILPTERYAELHAGPIQDFAAAIRERREPRTSLEKALVIQKISDAIYESAKHGKSVDIQ